MRLGFNLPQMGPAASPESIATIAERAEQLGYDSLWVTERLLFPVAPRTPYPVTADGSLPDVYKTVFDPVETLTWAAAHTDRVTLGTSVLDIPFYNPVVLARRLTTLDVLSGGRLKLGLGLGWSEDEHEAAGASLAGRGALADEFIRCLKTIWTADPVEFEGRHFKVPKSIIQPKPVQKPHPPIYLAAFAPAALSRVGRLANGWLPVGLPVPAMEQMLAAIRAEAVKAGRKAAEIEVVVRANVDVGRKARPADGPVFTGTPDQIRDDIGMVRSFGAAELHFDPTFSAAGRSVDGFLGAMERLKELSE